MPIHWKLLKFIFERFLMKLVLVESPAKAKTINKYLGPDFDVMATIGHIRNLPNKNGVNPDNNFQMEW